MVERLSHKPEKDRGMLEKIFAPIVNIIVAWFDKLKGKGKKSR